LAPLGPFVLSDLHITAAQFGFLVSAYAFSAGLSGLLAAGFADKFDRKYLLLFFYTGFVIGTFLCGIADSYHFLLGARIVTGLFGGVVGSIGFAIITDLFPMEVRGRVMGFVMSAFSASQVLGIPLGLYFSNHWGWRSPFWIIAGVAAVVGIAVVFRLQPLRGHLGAATEKNALRHLFRTVSRPRYLYGFAATALLATGGFMLMPFSSAFNVHNLGVPLDKLPLVFMVTGVASMIGGPLMGRLSDAIGKYVLFCLGSLGAIAIVLYYTRLEITPLWLVMVINAALFIVISARMISASTLLSAVPEMKDRGAFMAVNSSLQQLSGGVASLLAGAIVVQTANGRMEHYPVLGYVVVGATVITIILMYGIHRIAAAKARAAAAGVPAPSPAT
ncbi:MAG: MFS transporter, partial [Spirochaetia bacterium]|nr:MFS transporter [Spirochaetia bacterium]